VLWCDGVCSGYVVVLLCGLLWVVRERSLGTVLCAAKCLYEICAYHDKPIVLRVTSANMTHSGILEFV
jgi:hypothetical protein